MMAPGEGLFLMSEVPLYACTAAVLVTRVRGHVGSWLLLQCMVRVHVGARCTEGSRLGGEDVGDEGQTAHDSMGKYRGHVGNESRARDPGQAVHPSTRMNAQTFRRATPTFPFTPTPSGLTFFFMGDREGRAR